MKLFILFVIFISLQVRAEHWSRSNDPSLFNDKINYQFSQLPWQSTLKQDYKLWPGSHWASHLGGIANRWSSGKPQNFHYHRYSLNELKKLEEHIIEELSPAEKYDIYKGRYDYPTVAREWRRTSPYNTDWFGICQGEAAASLNHPEPQTVELINKDGIKILFYSSDVKALLSYYYAFYAKSAVKQIGLRCNTPQGTPYRRSQRKACKDMNAAAFHLLITNRLGLNGDSMIVDIDPNNEVWNHVAKGYSFDVYEEYDHDFEKPTPGTFKQYWVGMAVSYAGAIAPFFEPVIGLPQGYYIENNYQYLIDVDKTGKIIGGHWISDLRPDFTWLKEKSSFSGYWAKIHEIYHPREISN